MSLLFLAPHLVPMLYCWMTSSSERRSFCYLMVFAYWLELNSFFKNLFQRLPLTLELTQTASTNNKYWEKQKIQQCPLKHHWQIMDVPFCFWCFLIMFQAIYFLLLLLASTRLNFAVIFISSVSSCAILLFFMKQHNFCIYHIPNLRTLRCIILQLN